MHRPCPQMREMLSAASSGMVTTSKKVTSPVSFVASTSNCCSASFAMALAPVALVDISCWHPGLSLDIDIPMVFSLSLILLCDADEQGVLNTLQGDEDDDDEYVQFDLDAATVKSIAHAR